MYQQLMTKARTYRKHGSCVVRQLFPSKAMVEDMISSRRKSQDGRGHLPNFAGACFVGHGIRHNPVTFTHLKSTFPDLNTSCHGDMAFVVFRRYCVHEGGPGLTEAFFGVELWLMITCPCRVAFARSMRGMRPELSGIIFLVASGAKVTRSGAGMGRGNCASVQCAEVPHLLGLICRWIMLVLIGRRVRRS